jgi:hypothetical protein
MAEYRDVVIAGVPARVFGLAGLPRVSSNGVAVLFLLHGRERTQDEMRQTALEAVAASTERVKSDAKAQMPLLAVTLDARNHGERLVDAKRNASFRGADGQLLNDTHAVDMTAVACA